MIIHSAVVEIITSMKTWKIMQRVIYPKASPRRYLFNFSTDVKSRPRTFPQTFPTFPQPFFRPFAITFSLYSGISTLSPAWSQPHARAVVGGEGAIGSWHLGAYPMTPPIGARKGMGCRVPENPSTSSTAAESWSGWFHMTASHKVHRKGVICRCCGRFLLTEYQLQTGLWQQGSKVAFKKPYSEL